MDQSSTASLETGSDPVKDAAGANAALADSFLEWITADIEKVKQALESAKDKPSDNQAELREFSASSITSKVRAVRSATIC